MVGIRKQGLSENAKEGCYYVAGGNALARTKTRGW